jgi:hypothetical protein
MARRIGVDVFAVKFLRAQREHSWGSGCDVLDHDVEVELLGYGGIGPGRELITWRTLECQARRRVVGGDHNPVVVAVCHRQPSIAE